MKKTKEIIMISSLNSLKNIYLWKEEEEEAKQHNINKIIIIISYSKGVERGGGTSIEQNKTKNLLSLCLSFVVSSSFSSLLFFQRNVRFRIFACVLDPVIIIRFTGKNFFSSLIRKKKKKKRQIHPNKGINLNLSRLLESQIKKNHSPERLRSNKQIRAFECILNRENITKLMHYLWNVATTLSRNFDVFFFFGIKEKMTNILEKCQIKKLLDFVVWFFVDAKHFA